MSANHSFNHYQIKSNQTNYFIVCLKVDQRPGQLSLLLQYSKLKVKQFSFIPNAV